MLRLVSAVSVFLYGIGIEGHRVQHASSSSMLDLGRSDRDTDYWERWIKSEYWNQGDQDEWLKVAGAQGLAPQGLVAEDPMAMEERKAHWVEWLKVAGAQGLAPQGLVAEDPMAMEERKAGAQGLVAEEFLTWSTTADPRKIFARGMATGFHMAVDVLHPEARRAPASPAAAPQAPETRERHAVPETFGEASHLVIHVAAQSWRGTGLAQGLGKGSKAVFKDIKVVGEREEKLPRVEAEEPLSSLGPAGKRAFAAQFESELWDAYRLFADWRHGADLADVEWSFFPADLDPSRRHGDSDWDSAPRPPATFDLSTILTLRHLAELKAAVVESPEVVESHPYRSL